MEREEVKWGRHRPDTRTEEERADAARHQARVNRARGTAAVPIEIIPDEGDDVSPEEP